MRKTIILISLFFSSVFAYAQITEQIEKFELSATGNEYGIYTNINCEPENSAASTFYLWVDMQSPNDNQEVQAKIAFSVGNNSVNNKLTNLTKSLTKAKETFGKWKEIAKANSLKRIAKKMPISISDLELYFTQDGKWYSEKGVDMWFTFHVDAEGNSFMLLESDYMTSEEVVAYSTSRDASKLGAITYNSTIVHRYCSGACLIFTNEEEVDQFIAKLDKVVEWKKTKVENGKLLK